MKKYILTESQIRNLVNNVVDEGRWKKGEKGDTKYSPEYIKGVIEKYKGKLYDDFKKENYGLNQHLFRLGKDIHDDYVKDMIKKVRDPYTEDELKVIAKKYNTKNEFLKKSSSAYQSAIKKGPFITNPITGKKKNTYGFYDSITSHMEPDNNISKRMVYVHEFYDENHEPVAAYVGLTYNSEKRKQQHITGIGANMKEYLTPVTIFLREHPTYIHKYKELTDYIDANEAAKVERYWEHKYFENGWNVLNVAPTGRLGRPRKYSIKELRKIVDNIYNVDGIRTLNDFRKKYPKVYDDIREWGLNKGDDNMLSRFERFVYSNKKTDDEIINVALGKNNYSDVVKDSKLYDLLSRRNLKSKIKELFLQRKQQNEPIE
jgi:hypothetical protein